jgi:Divergent InlB B-repeat domain
MACPPTGASGDGTPGNGETQDVNPPDGDAKPGDADGVNAEREPRDGKPCDGDREQTATLTVDTDGEGSGTVTSDPPGIDCGEDCNEDYPAGEQVVLTATPERGSVFAAFSGDCPIAGQCTVTMDAPRSVTATFELDVPRQRDSRGITPSDH